MPIITLQYGADGRLYALFNATLRQSFNQFNPANATAPPVITEVLGHYYNQFVYNGDFEADNADFNPRPATGYWCMRTFNAFNSFAWSPNVGSYTLAPQNADNAQLSVFTRPI
jgi:hypothetical protein